GFDLDALTRASDGYSGAEIEEAVVSALFDAFHARQQLETGHILAALEQSVPLARTMSEQMDRLRQWAVGRARNAR
ncbi:MAG TPA: ATPase, partial [Candidatus Paceibacterota bacterium]|nr:ATPase [Candidatus Paceibacterota bacterium]